MSKTAITPTRAQNYPQWYQQVIIQADLAETSPVRGCMVIKPWGYGIWENIQQEMDRRFRATGHVNAYFPLLIPLSYLEREAEHVEGFAKECAVVTHSRLETNEAGKLIPAGELEEPYIIRPTSETLFGEMYAKWIQSYRDLPVLINQWANVMRWEMRTRLFLRTSEFLWQEGHTAHATKEEAIEETLKMLEVYREVVEDVLAIPVIKGEKTIGERFPGAMNTFCIEAMMQDKKALQAGTSHFLGQNFAKASNIQFLNESGNHEYVWTTSWGTSTRLVGALIMTHSDDDGLVLPPKVAAQHIVILPIYRNDEEKDNVLTYCESLKKALSDQVFNYAPIRIHIDKRDIRGGDKNWQWIKKGVPIRLEIGPRDVANNSVFMAKRTKAPKEKQGINREEFIKTASQLLSDIQLELFERAKKFRQDNTHTANSLDEFNHLFKANSGFVACYAVDDPIIDPHLAPHKVTPRCIPLNQDHNEGQCIFTGKTVKHKTIFAKAY